MQRARAASAPCGGRAESRHVLSVPRRSPPLAACRQGRAYKRRGGRSALSHHAAVAMATRQSALLPLLVVAAALLAAARALSVAGERSSAAAPEGQPEAEAEVAAPGADVGGGGDAYLAEAAADCETSGASWPCTKARLLRLAVRVASSPRQIAVWGPVSLSPVDPATSSPGDEAPLFAASVPRAGDSEADKAGKFCLRLVERYARSHALRLELPPSDHADVEGELAAPESRGKKKKAAILLPLVLFLKLKALLVPTLLGVLFIKKLLVLAAVFLPALLHYLKACKFPQHHHSVAYHVPHGDWSSSGADPSAAGLDGPSGYSGGSSHYASRKHLAGGRRAAYRRQRY